MTKKPFRVIFSTFFEKVCFAASFFVLHGFHYKFFTGAAIFFYGHYNIMQIMLSLLCGMAFLYYQVQILHAAAVFRAGGYNIYPRGVYAAVTQNIGKLCKVLFDLIK